uniref:Uncharacterized protein n=1 Tax=Parascaris univalens TaxID=6257 RepID=A0A915AAT4_PARUN
MKTAKATVNGGYNSGFFFMFIAQTSISNTTFSFLHFTFPTTADNKGAIKLANFFPSVAVGISVRRLLQSFFREEGKVPRRCTIALEHRRNRLFKRMSCKCICHTSFANMYDLRINIEGANQVHILKKGQLIQRVVFHYDVGCLQSGAFGFSRFCWNFGSVDAVFLENKSFCLHVSAKHKKQRMNETND